MNIKELESVELCPQAGASPPFQEAVRPSRVVRTLLFSFPVISFLTPGINDTKTKVTSVRNFIKLEQCWWPPDIFLALFLYFSYFRILYLSKNLWNRILNQSDSENYSFTTPSPIKQKGILVIANSLRNVSSVAVPLCFLNTRKTRRGFLASCIYSVNVLMHIIMNSWCSVIPIGHILGL